MKSFLALTALTIAAPALAQTPAQTNFLRAADAGDISAMAQMLPGRIGLRGGATMPSKLFLKQISACYLRRAYAGDGGDMLASWMCQAGNGSKMIVAHVLDQNGSVAIEAMAETLLTTPAPARAGSALPISALAGQ